MGLRSTKKLLRWKRSKSSRLPTRCQPRNTAEPRAATKTSLQKPEPTLFTVPPTKSSAMKIWTRTPGSTISTVRSARRAMQHARPQMRGLSIRRTITVERLEDRSGFPGFTTAMIRRFSFFPGSSLAISWSHKPVHCPYGRYAQRGFFIACHFQYGQSHWHKSLRRHAGLSRRNLRSCYHENREWRSLPNAVSGQQDRSQSFPRCRQELASLLAR